MGAFPWDVTVDSLRQISIGILLVPKSELVEIIPPFICSLGIMLSSKLVELIETWGSRRVALSLKSVKLGKINPSPGNAGSSCYSCLMKDMIFAAINLVP